MDRPTQILVDTSVFIDHLRKKKKENTLLLRAIARFDRLFISAVTVYEVEFGSEKQKRPSDIEPFLDDVVVIALDAELA
ncbi:MAG: PIN domain-containing protein, partial [Myxococcota bacterium]|nr:PIN domain-containing protein [Myxococcota bacterium]